VQYRTLGKTGLRVSEIGYGTWGIGKTGWAGANDEQSIRGLNTAIDLGLNFIDTALRYGNGHSERLVGQVVRARRETVYVATKAPPKNLGGPAGQGNAAEDAFPKDFLIEATEQSLRNLGLETIDIFQFHRWSNDWVGQGDWLEAIQQLKQQGKIRFFGVSINDHQPDSALRLVESGVVDTVQVIYNIFDQSPEDQLFSACREHNVGVIVRVPLDEGGLTGKVTPETVFAADDFQNRYFRGDRKREVYDRARRIAEDLAIPLDQLPEAALRYTLSDPAVSTIIPGMRSVHHVAANCAVADGKGLPPEQVQRLKAHRWVRNFYSD